MHSPATFFGPGNPGRGELGTRPRTIVVTAALVLAACAAGDLAGQAGDVRRVVEAGRTSGAARCAPRELAVAQAHFDFAKQNLEIGASVRAEEHLRLARIHAQQAVRLSPPELCNEQHRHRDWAYECRNDSNPAGGNGCPAR